MTRDKRRDPRIDLHFKMIYIGLKGERPYEVKNLSMSGLFIETAKPSKFRVGDEIELIMREPADDRLMLLDARVVRAGKKGIAVEFLNVTAEDQETLKTCFDLFRHTLPKIDS